MRFLFVCVLLLCFPGFAFSEAEQIKIGGSPNLSPLVFVAMEQGFFTKRNIDVSYEQINVGKQAMDATISGQVDCGVIVDTNAAFISFQKSSLKIITRLLMGTDNTLVVRTDSGIESAKDLKGKRIAYLPATTADYYLYKTLSSAGLSTSDVKSVTLQPQAMLPALKGGAVDAVIIWEPWRYTIHKELEGSVRDVLFPPELYQYNSFFVCNETAYSKKKEALREIVKALKEAEVFAKEHPEKFLPIVSKYANLPENVVETMTGKHVYEVSLPRSAIEQVKQIAEWIKATKPDYAEGVPDVEAVFAPLDGE